MFNDEIIMNVQLTGLVDTAFLGLEYNSINSPEILCYTHFEAECVNSLLTKSYEVEPNHIQK